MLSRVIASAEEIAVAKYRLAGAHQAPEEMSRRPSFNLPGTRDLGVALESAIDRVETIHSKHDSSLEAIRSLDRLADISEAKAQAPGRIVHHDAVMSMNIHAELPRDTYAEHSKSSMVSGCRALTQAAIVVILAVGGCLVLNHQFGFLKPHFAGTHTCS